MVLLGAEGEEIAAGAGSTRRMRASYVQECRSKHEVRRQTGKDKGRSLRVRGRKAAPSVEFVWRGTLRYETNEAWHREQVRSWARDTVKGFRVLHFERKDRKRAERDQRRRGLPM